MRAIAIQAFGGPEAMALTDLPRPKPGRGEILMRIVACGVNPVDWKIREGRLPAGVTHAFPIVLGWDAAGVVDELGEGCQRFRKGDRVLAYARRPHVQWGTYAEYVAVPERHVSLMPSVSPSSPNTFSPDSGSTSEMCVWHPLPAESAHGLLMNVAR